MQAARYEDIEAEVRRVGLILRGGFDCAAEDSVPSLPDGRPAQSLVLVGNAGSAVWPVFKESEEARDGMPNALDRWTRRNLARIAECFGAQAFFPFDGPPYRPFQHWAQRAEPVQPSPLGILMHPEFGLWHAYRGALAFVHRIEMPAVQERPSPCLTCADKPCLSACPVSAFSSEGYDVASCASHISGDEGNACMDGGCLARLACPVGADHRYVPAHQQFHMRAFLRSRQED